MKKITLLALAFLTAGCHFGSATVCHYDASGNHHCHADAELASHSHHESTTIVTTSANYGGGYNNILIVEEPSYCQWDQPYYHDPEWCVLDYDSTCCMWMGVGAEETYCYYDYCGWELVEVYSYY